MNGLAGLSKTETNIKLPFSFIFYSLLAFAGSQFALIFSGDLIVNGAFRIPPLWMAAHFLLLGWALMVAMGSMYQLVPVAFLTPIWSEKFGFAQFGVTAIGITGFSLSLGYYPKFILLTGVITIVGILMFLVQMFMTLRKQAEKNILTLFVGSALLSLLITITLGILLAASVGGYIGLNNHETILKTHILFGVAGWFTLLIFGFSYKMVPMFSLSHGFSMKLSKPLFVIYFVGLLSTAISFWTNQAILFQLGMLLLLIGFSLFVWNMKEIINKRLKKKLDNPFIFSLIAILIGWVIHLAAAVASFISISSFVYGVLIYIYIIGWIVFSIIGYLFKIVPFLWWTHRYSKEMGKPNVPTLKQLMNDKLGTNLFILFFVCMLGMVISFAFQLTNLYTTFQILLAIVSTVFSIAIMVVVKK
ncbi:hypothetical protein [Bacillus sp. Marseille-P3661]|uniref:hypothetical protein n=1 Tax=Bacillus sp. Marseille-P3661 TaxID=1936234 RepID=UPI000C8614E4|nr:hypothetical protein [Bacillus sp. Marseille-P3661]